MAVFGDDLFRKADQRLFVGNIAHEIGIIQQIDGTNLGTGFLEFLTNALADAHGTAGNYHNFVLEHFLFSFHFLEELCVSDFTVPYPRPIINEKPLPG